MENKEESQWIRTTRLIEEAHKGDKEARDRLVEENLGLIWKHSVSKIWRQRTGDGGSISDWQHWSDESD